MLTDFIPGELGFLQAWLVGGPLDGTTHNDMPLALDGKPAGEAAIPLDGALFALYARRDNVSLDGRWHYDFIEVTADSTPLPPLQIPTRAIVGSTSSVSELPQNEAPQGTQSRFVPASRFVLAQAWWIASELCRRHSKLRIIDAWPLDGHYHGLEVGEQLDHDHVFMNFLGRIHQHPYSFSTDLEPIDWGRVVSAESPHEIVRELEHGMRWETRGADPTTPRSLVYRCIASILATKIDDRERWNVADAFTHGGFVEWPDFLAEFEGCRLELQKDRVAAPPPSMRVWVLTRGRTIVALLSDMGILFKRDEEPQGLMRVYQVRRQLDDVTGLILNG